MSVTHCNAVLPRRSFSCGWPQRRAPHSTLWSPPLSACSGEEVNTSLNYTHNDLTNQSPSEAPPPTFDTCYIYYMWPKLGTLSTDQSNPYTLDWKKKCYLFLNKETLHKDTNYPKIILFESYKEFWSRHPSPPSSPMVPISIPVMAKDDILSERVSKAQLADTGGLWTGDNRSSPGN